MFADPNNGNVVSFIPVSLLEGAASEPLTIEVTPELEESILRGRTDAAASIWARIAPSAFQDIAVTGLDLSSHFGSSVDVDFKIIAAMPLPGVTRVLLSAGIARRAAAAWLD